MRLKLAAAAGTMTEEESLRRTARATAKRVARVRVEPAGRGLGFVGAGVWRLVMVFSLLGFELLLAVAERERERA